MTRARKIGASVFVVIWLFVFNYESLRYNYLNRWLGAELPKVKLLFPPAGWIMFYRVDKHDGHAEVYGVKNREPVLIDPHRIFANRWVGYDNIRRNILITVLNPRRGAAFCAYLMRKFPEYDNFLVMEAFVADVTARPQKTVKQASYMCR